MGKNIKRVLSMLLTLAITLSAVPVSAVIPTTAAEEPAYLANLDFEDGSIPGDIYWGSTVTSVHVQEAYRAEVLEKNGNHVLHLESDGSDYLRWAYDLGKNYTSRVTLSYHIAVGEKNLKNSRMHFLSFNTDASNLRDSVVKFGKVNGVTDLSWTDSGNAYLATNNDKAAHPLTDADAKVSIGDLRWHTVKIVYTPAGADTLVEVWLDGVLTDISNCKEYTRTQCISLSLLKAAGELYLDNIRLTVDGVDHTPAGTPACLGEHAYDRQVATDTYKASGATCSAAATYYYSCACGAKGTETFAYGEALPHSYTGENGVCVNGCGKAEGGNSSNVDYLVNFDFEDGVVPGAVSNGDAADVTVQTMNGNKVLVFDPTTTASTRWNYALGGSYSQVTVSYNVAVESSSGIMMFPSITDAGISSPNVEFGMRSGALKYSTKSGTPTSDILGVATGKNVAYKEKIWYTVKIVYDYDASSVKVYIDGVETNVGIGRTIAASQKIQNIVVKFYGKSGVMYVDNLCVTVGGLDHEPAVATPLQSSEHGLSNGDTGYVGDTLDLTMDFENVEEGYYPGKVTLSEGYTTEDAPHYFVGVKEMNSNKVLLVDAKTTGSNDSVGWTYSLGGKYTNVTLSYYVAQVNLDPQYFALPSLSNQYYWNPVVRFGKMTRNGGELMGYVNKTGWVETKFADSNETVPYELLKWQQVKLIYTVENEVPNVKVYIDGQLTNIAYSEIATSLDVSQIAVRLAGGSAGIYDGRYYVDNIRVTANDHAPLEEPKALISSIPVDNITADRSSVSVTVGGHQYIHAVAHPADAGNKDLTYISSNPNVATVDEWGEVIGVAEGNATITITSKANSTIKIQIPVAVEKRNIMQVIYVSTVGGGSGSSVNDRCTIQEAMDQVSALHDSMTGDIIVSLSAGYYQLTETLMFNVTHGGNNNHYVIYKAEGKVTIGGKKVITGWTDTDGDGIYSAPAAGIATRHLFVDGIRATRARSKSGLRNEQVLYDGNETSIGYISDNLELISYAHPEDLEFVYYYGWFHPRASVGSVALNNTTNKVEITMSQPGWSWVRSGMQTADETSMYYENALELLDEPGEWYLDVHSGIVYYMPRQWENMTEVEITMPVVEELMRIEGEDYNKQVQNIQFKGIIFADATWNYPTEKGVLAIDQNNHLEEGDTNHDHLIDGAVTLMKANSVNFTDCEFTRIGSIGLKIVDGSQNCKTTGSKFYEISGSAVSIGEPYWFEEDIANPSDPYMVLKNCDLYNNYIHHIGVDYQSSAAISIGFAADMDIAYNEIFDTPYSGFHIGYGWKDKQDSILRNLRIEHNLIYDTMTGDIRDGGAIYTVGKSGGTPDNFNIIANNYIRNSLKAESSLYPDGGSVGYYYTNNVVDESERTKYGLTTTKPRGAWIMVYKPGNNKQEHLKAEDNYITVDYDRVDAGGYNVNIELGILCDPNNYPAEARTIIENAGLQSSYAHIQANYAERVRMNFGQALELKNIGDNYQVVATAYDGKDNDSSSISNADLFVHYSVEDTTIASVTADGLVTSKATGSTVLYVTVISGTVIREYSYDIYVADVLTEIKVQSNTLQGGIALYTGANAYAPVVTGKMALGREVILTDVTLTVADTGIAYVQDGKIVPKSVGKTKLIITGRYNGVAKTITCELEIKGTGTSQGNGPVLSNMKEMFDPQYKNYWKYTGAYIPTGGIQYGDGTIFFAGQYDGNFVGTTYLNELLTFGMYIDITTGTGGWPAIVIRNQDPYDYPTNGSCYIICFDGTEGLEFYRFNDGKRTQFYGNVSGYEQILGPCLKGVYKDNTYYEVQYGAINEADGVRIILRLNGVEIINYLDTSSKAIREAGYFGICGRRETMTLTYIPLANGDSDCIDENKDHICDDCGKSVGLHAPAVGAHTCDYCGQKISDCNDANADHLCDDCKAELSVCADTDSNHKCDVCGTRVTWCVDEDKDHICDVCTRKTRCADTNPKDHLCDTCEKVLSECADKKPKDHMCDTCGKELSQCADEDSNHVCDLCDKQITQCVDENKDKKCDICGADYTASKNPVILVVVLLVVGALGTGGAAAIIIVRKKHKQ